MHRYKSENVWRLEVTNQQAALAALAAEAVGGNAYNCDVSQQCLHTFGELCLIYEKHAFQLYRLIQAC